MEKEALKKENAKKSFFFKAVSWIYYFVVLIIKMYCILFTLKYFYGHLPLPQRNAIQTLWYYYFPDLILD